MLHCVLKDLLSGKYSLSVVIIPDGSLIDILFVKTVNLSGCAGFELRYLHKGLLRLLHLFLLRIDSLTHVQVYQVALVV